MTSPNELKMSKSTKINVDLSAMALEKSIGEETISDSGSNDPIENDDDSVNSDALDYTDAAEETIFDASGK